MIVRSLKEESEIPLRVDDKSLIDASKAFTSSEVKELVSIPKDLTIEGNKAQYSSWFLGKRGNSFCISSLCWNKSELAATSFLKSSLFLYIGISLILFFPYKSVKLAAITVSEADNLPACFPNTLFTFFNCDILILFSASLSIKSIWFGRISILS